MIELTFNDIKKSHQRIKSHVINTKITTNPEIDQDFGSKLFFKCDNLQKTNSFKARGAFNAILSYREKHGKFPEKIVAVSSGNHAQAIAYVCKEFDIKVLIYMAKNTPEVKIAATKSLGAQIVICEKRATANKLSQEKIAEGYYFIHPSADQDVITGQGSACLEALEEIGEVDAIFTPVGGGGLVAGTFLAAQGLSPNAKIFGCEPKNANDAAISLRQNKIFSFTDSPDTIADGARTLAVMPICFDYLKKITAILEIPESEIISAQKQFLSATKTLIEPTSALAIAGAKQYCQENKGKKILVIISGGNV